MRSASIGTSAIAFAFVAAACSSAAAPGAAHHLAVGEQGQLPYTVQHVKGTLVLDVTVDSVDASPQVVNPVAPNSGAVPPDPGTHWVAVSLTMHAANDHGYQGGRDDFSLLASNGQHYQDHPEVTTSDETEAATVYRVPGNQTVTNVTLFEVADGARPTRLTFTDATAVVPRPDQYLAWDL